MVHTLLISFNAAACSSAFGSSSIEANPDAVMRPDAIVILLNPKNQLEALVERNWLLAKWLLLDIEGN